MSPPDVRRWLRLVPNPESDEPEPAPPEVQLEQAYGILERLHSTTVEGLDELGPGICDDCRHEAERRWTLGRVELCRACVGARKRVAARTAPWGP